MEEQGSSRHDASLAQAGEPKRGAGRLAPGSSGASRPIRLLDSFDIWYRPEVLLKGISPRRASLDRGRIRLGPAASWSPAVEIEQRDDNLVITAALPGLALEDIKIEAIGNVLILQGDADQTAVPEEARWDDQSAATAISIGKWCCRMAWTRSGCVLNLRMGCCASPFRS